MPPIAEQDHAAPLSRLSARELTILRSAYHVMARAGGHRLNLQDIADEAGTSKGLVLYHFATKGNVLQHAMRWALLETAARIRASVERAREEGSDELQALLDAIFISAEANHDFQLVYLDLIEHSVREAAFAELPEMIRDIIETLYAEVVRGGVEQGVYAVEDVERAALAMRVVIDGTFLQWLQRSDWQQSHGDFKRLCHETLTALLC